MREIFAERERWYFYTKKFFFCEIMKSKVRMKWKEEVRWIGQGVVEEMYIHDQLIGNVSNK